MPRFIDLDEASLRDALLIIDVDGTLIVDGATSLDAAAVAKLRALASGSEVYLCSNGLDRERLKSMAVSAGVSHIDTIHYKPSKRVLEAIPHAAGKRVVVIGDKRLTDGLFARNIDAEFIHVERLRSASERFFIRALYRADDLAAAISLMRPLQWVKNLLVFAPLFFAHAAFDISSLTRTLLAFIAFSLFASAAYVMNDFADKEQDRLHPKKRNRPLASGAISSRGAFILIGVLVVGGCTILTVIPHTTFVILIYVILNILYTFFLKRIAFADVVCVSTFYVLRVLAGGFAADIFISPWIILCTFFGAMTLIVGKRRAEYDRPQKRAVLTHYRKEFLTYILITSSVLATIAYAIWSVVATPDPLMMYSSIFVAAALFFVVKAILAGTVDAETPEVLVFKNKVVLGTFTLWMAYVGTILYLI